MSEKLGICDIATHANGWVAIAPGVRHERLAGCVNWREPVASPQATRPERICGNCGLPLVQGETEEMCRELDKVAARLEARRATQPAAGTTPLGAMDVERYTNHKDAQAIAHKYGLDPSEESFAKAVGAILYVTNLGLAVRDAWRKRADAAEAKLAEHGIVWEEGKGYVFNGKD